MTSPFIIFDDKDKNGNLQHYILQRDFPHYIGIISNRPIETALIQQPIAGYNMYVLFNGTLSGNRIPLDKGALEEAENVYYNMACWYYADKIVMDKQKFERYKINTNDNIGTK